MTRVSVIIPAYHPSAYLTQAVRSVVGQTSPAMDIIIINDGSHAQYLPLFDSIATTFPQITLHHLPANQGVAHARNTGAALASGDYLAFLDQDDCWHKEKIFLQAAYLDTHPTCDFVTSRQRYFLADGVDKAPSWVKPEHINTSLPGFLPGTLMVRTTTFQILGGFDETLKAGTDDVDWFFRAADRGLIHHELPEELLFKRIHGSNVSKAAQTHNRELLAVVRNNIERKKQRQGQAS